MHFCWQSYLFISFYTSPYLCLAITSCKASHSCISVSQYFFLLLRIALNSYLWPKMYIIITRMKNSPPSTPSPCHLVISLSHYLATSYLALSCHLPCLSSSASHCGDKVSLLHFASSSRQCTEKLCTRIRVASFCLLTHL